MIHKLRHSRAYLIYVAFIASSMSAMPLAAAQSRVMNIQLCTADGEIRTASILLDEGDNERGGHCPQPCHACLSRDKESGKSTKS